MNNVSIKQTNNGFVVYLNEYKSSPCAQGTWVARSIEELEAVLKVKVYPVLDGGTTDESDKSPRVLST